MSALLRQVTARGLTPIARVTVQSKANILAGPPKNSIPLTEKVISGIILAVCVTAPSAYILANIQNYRKRD